MVKFIIIFFSTYLSNNLFIIIFLELENSVLLSSDDILKFSSLLDLSIDLPITISMLQANPIIAKNIKSISKMKTTSSNNSEEPYISSLQKLSSSASEVVKAWKSRIIVVD